MADTPSISDQTGIRSYDEYKQTRTVKQSLGKDDFLQLLAAQLQYQNPLEPMQDTDFIAQLAQFSSLQQMESLNTTMSTYQYFGMAGKYVYAEVKLDTGEEVAIRGVVDRVVMSDGKPYAQVGEYLIDCTKISQVYDKDIFTGGQSFIGNSSLIGKYIRANVPGDKEGETKIASGKCVRVAIENNVMLAYLDTGEKVGLGDVFDISDTEIIVKETVPGDNTEQTNNTETGDGDEPADNTEPGENI